MSSSVGSKLSSAASRLKRKRDSTDTSPSPSNSEPEQTRTKDVPALSHAARRKQKKAQALLTAAVPAKSSTKKQKKEEEASHLTKRQNSIWAGNLCYKTTPESLRRFFDGVGEITRVHLPTKLGKASPGESAKRENRGCGSTATLSNLLAYPPVRQFCLCGFCDARGQESRYFEDRVASGWTPPFNQGRCVHRILPVHHTLRLLTPVRRQFRRSSSEARSVTCWLGAWGWRSREGPFQICAKNTFCAEAATSPHAFLRQPRFRDDCGFNQGTLGSSSS